MSSLSSGEAGLIVFAVVSSSLAGTYFALARARRRPSERARIIAAARRNQDVDLDRDVGPDSLRLLQDLDAHLDEYAATLTGLYEPAAAPAPHAGLAELRQAIRDEQQKETGDA